MIESDRFFPPSVFFPFHGLGGSRKCRSLRRLALRVLRGRGEDVLGCIEVFGSALLVVRERVIYRTISCLAEGSSRDLLSRVVR